MSVHSSTFRPNAVRTIARISAILIALACGDSTSPPPAPARYLVTSAASSPIAGSQILLTAQLVDADDKPLAIGGRNVVWISTNAGVQPRDTSRGAFSPVSSITLANGSASTTFLTNTVAGVTHKITVIDASGIRGTAADITTVAGPGVAYAVTPSTTQPVVGSGVVISAQLTDHYENPSKTAGRVVTWSTTTIPAGSFSSPTSTTNSDGIATVTFTIGAIAGAAYTVSATDDQLASGVSTVFHSTGGPVAKYIVSASLIDPPAGADITIYAQASDANGNPAAAGGRPITWSKTGSGGSFALAMTITGDGGGATVTFTTGTVGGTTYTITGTDAGGLAGTSPNITTQPQLSLASMATGVGALSSCGIASDGRAWCWGANGTGALGNGTGVDRSLAGRVSGNLTMTSLSAGYFHACGVTGGVVQCWGNNPNGELGDNTTTSRSVPAAIASSLTFTSVASGGAHTCALATGGNVYCWGSIRNGRLGDGSLATSGTNPVKVVGGLSFASVSAGGSHTCGVTTTGDAYCWGANGSGQLGDNSLTDRSTPVAVAGGLKFTSVSAGDSHTCGIVTGGAAYCWGDGTYGQLGFVAPIAQNKAPAPVSGGLSFAAISAGGFHTCGITTGSAALCWGDNSTGELGNLNSSASASPSQVAGGLLFKSISAGGLSSTIDGGYYYGTYTVIEAHTCGVTTAGVTYCWGSNDRGELGYGPAPVQSLAPLKVGGQP